MKKSALVARRRGAAGVVEPGSGARRRRRRRRQVRRAQPIPASRTPTRTTPSPRHRSAGPPRTRATRSPGSTATPTRPAASPSTTWIISRPSRSAPTTSRAASRTKIDDPNNLERRLLRQLLLRRRSGRHLPRASCAIRGGNCANQVDVEHAARSRRAATGSWRSTTIRRSTSTTPANAPIRVAHGGTPLPAALIVRPDGYGAWDTSYHLQWLADGKAPLTLRSRLRPRGHRHRG